MVYAIVQNQGDEGEEVVWRTIGKAILYNDIEEARKEYIYLTECFMTDAAQNYVRIKKYCHWMKSSPALVELNNGVNIIEQCVVEDCMEDFIELLRSRDEKCEEYQHEFNNKVKECHADYQQKINDLLE